MKTLIIISIIGLSTIISAGQNIMSNFEPDGENISFNNNFGGSVIEVIENPYINEQNSSEYVGKTYKSDYEMLDWGGMYADLMGESIRINENTKARIQIFAENNPGLFKLKFENYHLDANGQIEEFDYQIDKVGEWITVEFDISRLQDEYFNRIVVFFDLGQTDGDVFYFDNFEIVN